ncbi:MAG TPA: hypothetical protein EYH34_05940 [Planctomycetes bacterium]|nr:hypothetical protein [Planctomycetota bacterium]
MGPRANGRRSFRLKAALRTNRFRRRFPAEQLFNRLLDHNRQIGHPQNLSVIFQKRVPPRTAAKAKTHISQPYDANAAIRSTYETNWLKQYLRDHRLLRTEAVCNNPYDFGVNKSIENLTLVRRRLHDAVARYPDVQQDVLETYLDAGQLRRLGQPTISPTGRRTLGLKLDDPRLLAVMQAVVSFTHLASGGPFTTSAIHPSVARALDRSRETYTLSQLRYDLGKLRAKGLVEKIPRSHRYQLTGEGYRVCLLFLKLFHQVYAPLTAAAWQAGPQNNTPRPTQQSPTPARHRRRPAAANSSPPHPALSAAPSIGPAAEVDRLATLDRRYAAVDHALDRLLHYVGIRLAA